MSRDILNTHHYDLLDVFIILFFGGPTEAELIRSWTALFAESIACAKHLCLQRYIANKYRDSF